MGILYLKKSLSFQQKIHQISFFKSMLFFLILMNLYLFTRTGVCSHINGIGIERFQDNLTILDQRLSVRGWVFFFVSDAYFRLYKVKLRLQLLPGLGK